MLELPKLGRMIYVRWENFVSDAMDRNCDAIRRLGVANFAYIIKIATTFIKTSF